MRKAPWQSSNKELVIAMSKVQAQTKSANSVLSEGRRCRAGLGAPRSVARSLPPELGRLAPTSPARPDRARAQLTAASATPLGPQNPKTFKR